MASLRNYYPDAKAEDFEYQTAGQRVQILKNDPVKGPILQFGTELVASEGKTLVALLGASPGASVSAKIALDTLNLAFKEKLSHEKWQETLKKMVPSYGQSLADNPELFNKVKERTEKFLKLH